MRPGGSRIGEASPYSATWVQTPQGVWLTGRKLDMKSVAVTALGIPKVGLVAAPKVIVLLVASP